MECKNYVINYHKLPIIFGKDQSIKVLYPASLLGKLNSASTCMELLLGGIATPLKKMDLNGKDKR